MSRATFPALLAGDTAAALAAVYVIHGEEELLHVEALDAIRSTARAQGATRQVFTPEKDDDWSTVLGSAASMGLFGDRQLLEIHIPNGKPGKAGAAALEKLAAAGADTVVVVVLPKLERTALQSAWFAALARAGEVYEARPVAQDALPNWIRTRLKGFGLTIEDDALTVLAERVEGNLLAARQEIEKLALLYARRHTLTLSEIAAAVANVAKFDPFQLAAAWMLGDSARLARLLTAIEAEGEEPVLVLWAVSEDIRSIIRFKAALHEGQKPAAAQASLRLWGEKKTAAPVAAKRLSVRRLTVALSGCAQADRQIKGAETGKAWATLKQLLLELAVSSPTSAKAP